MKNKVSIIVPVYNGQDFIDRCLNQLLNQTYNNIEIIVINDGSTDNSLNLLKKYEDKIILINKNNSGVSNSRNLGLEASTGEYIMFCDIDDWYENNAVEIAIKNIKNVDFLKFKEFISYSEKTKKKKIELLNDGIYNNENLSLIRSLFNFEYSGHIYCFIYKKSIINDYNIRFDEDIRYLEDVLFIIKYLLKCNKVKIIDEYLYNYYQNSNSVTNNISSIYKNLDNLYVFRKNAMLILDGICDKELDRFLLNLILLYLEKPFNIFDNIKDIKEYYKNVCFSLKKIISDLNLNECSMKWKILIFMIKNDKYNMLYLYIKLYLKMR